MKRTLKAAAAVAVSLGLVVVGAPVSASPDVGLLSVGSTGCCKN